MTRTAWVSGGEPALADAVAARLRADGVQVARGLAEAAAPVDAVVLLPPASPSGNSGSSPDARDPGEPVTLASAGELLAELRRWSDPMTARGGGRLVVVRRAPSTSVDVDASLLAASSEAGVTAMVRGLARALAPAGVTVNVVLLGGPASGARPATLDDIASLVAMLVHAEAGYLTGQCFPLVGAPS